jgi:hypothetical protein
MKDTTLSKLGGTCSILTGVAFVVVVVVYLLLPPEQQDACGCPDRFLASLAHNSTAYVVDYAVLGLYPLLAIAAVLAISATVRAGHDGWVRWTSTLAIVGLVVTAIDAIRHAALDPTKATAYVQGDAAVKAALTVPGALQGLDPQGWLRYGASGLWILVVSLLALRGGTWPRPLAFAGIGVALLALLLLGGQVAQSQSLLAIVGGAGGVILLPLWYVWLGLRLRQAG